MFGVGGDLNLKSPIQGQKVLSIKLTRIYLILQKYVTIRESSSTTNSWKWFVSRQLKKIKDMYFNLYNNAKTS